MSADTKTNDNEQKRMEHAKSLIDKSDFKRAAYRNRYHEWMPVAPKEPFQLPPDSPYRLVRVLTHVTYGLAYLAELRDDVRIEKLDASGYNVDPHKLPKQAFIKTFETVFINHMEKGESPTLPEDVLFDIKMHASIQYSQCKRVEDERKADSDAPVQVTRLLTNALLSEKEWSYVVYEFQPQHDLMDLMMGQDDRNECLSMAQIMSAARCLIRTVATINEQHSLAVVDIKPENLLVSSHDPLVLRMCDFGHAQRLHPVSSGGADDALTLHDEGLKPRRFKLARTSSIGTNGYRPPEQYIIGGWVDHALCDSWAVGCVLFIIVASLPHYNSGGADHMTQFQRVNRALFKTEGGFNKAWIKARIVQLRQPRVASEHRLLPEKFIDRMVDLIAMLLAPVETRSYVSDLLGIPWLFSGGGGATAAISQDDVDRKGLDLVVTSESEDHPIKNATQKQRQQLHSTPVMYPESAAGLGSITSLVLM